MNTLLTLMKKQTQNSIGELLAKIGYLLLILHLLWLSVLFLYSLYYIDYSYLPVSFLYRIALFILPVILWVWGTNYTYFNYHKRKVLSFQLVVCTELILLLTILFQLLSMLLLPAIMEIHTDEIFTKGMVLFLARLLCELPLLLLGIVAYSILRRPIVNEHSLHIILDFKLSHYVWQYNNFFIKQRTGVIYNLAIAKDITTGKPIIVAEKDRYLHALIDGSSGTAKTSSTILPAIKDDLNMRSRAEHLQKQALQALLSTDKIECRSQAPFSINNYQPAASLPKSEQKNAEKELDQIRMQTPVAGVTVLAPDDSLTDDVARLCDARNIPYNRIDVTLTSDGEKKKNCIGMNPFYVPDNLDPTTKHQLIVKKAIIFSDVMQAITDLKGKADSYFTGLNRQMISNIAILVMNTVPEIHKRYATPADLQSLINNYDLLPTYVQKFQMLDQKEKRYTYIIQYINHELLGAGRVKMEDQSRGTRNIINEFLLLPENKEVFCAQNTIDFDRVLANGEVTVCNYNLAAGESNALAFGLFFFLSFNNAVLSRPGNEHTRTPHFWYIDELPVLIHSSLERNYSLFRKFRVAMFSAIQALDQFDKNELTKYLKGVVLGSAHMLVFGRSSLSDMKVFSEMAGVHLEADEQNTVTESSLSDEDTSLSYSSRESITQKNTLEEIDVRMKDFQEATFFTVQNGRPLPPLHVRVDFLKPSDWEAPTWRKNPFDADAFGQREQPLNKPAAFDAIEPNESFDFEIIAALEEIKASTEPHKQAPADSFTGQAGKSTPATAKQQNEPPAASQEDSIEDLF